MNSFASKIRSSLGPLLWPVVSLFLILAFNGLFTPGFFHLEMKDGHLYGSLVDIVYRAAPVILISLGMTLVIATGGVDLSVGSVCAIAGAVAAVKLPSMGAGGAVALALAASIVCGALNGAMVAVLEIQPIVATLVLMISGRGAAQLLTDGQIIATEHPFFRTLGGGFFGGLPVAVTICAIAFVIMIALCWRTALGLFVESVGSNPVASRYAGIDTRIVRLTVYGISAALAGVAGLLITADIGAADANNSGVYLELDAILAVVLGGTSLSGGRFSLAGSVLGAVIIQSVTTTINTRNVPIQYTLVIKALIVLAACLLQSEGFRRKFSRRSFA